MEKSEKKIIINKDEKEKERQRKKGIRLKPNVKIETSNCA